MLTYIFMFVVFLGVVFISILPAVLIGKYIYKRDKDKEPRSLIIKILIFEFFSTIIVILLIKGYNFLFPTQKNFFEKLCKYIIGVGLIEEIFKFLPAYFIGIKSKYFDDVYDAILYTSISALVFAGIENIYYVFTGGISTAILRFFTAVPGHACWGVIMGYFIGIAYQYKNNSNIKKFRLNMFYSIFIPMFFHGIYDLGLVLGVETLNFIAIIISFLIDICFMVYAIRRVIMISNKNEKLSSNTLKDNNSGLKLILIGFIVVFLMFVSSKINLFNNFYSIDDIVSVKEDLINIKVNSYEEIKILDDEYVKINISIENRSDSINSIIVSKFKLMDNNAIYLEQNNVNFSDILLDTTIVENQTLVGNLYFRKNDNSNDKNKYVLIYCSLEEYAIVLDENISSFVNE